MTVQAVLSPQASGVAALLRDAEPHGLSDSFADVLSHMFFRNPGAWHAPCKPWAC
jgi:hypothetical protein